MYKGPVVWSDTSESVSDAYFATFFHVDLLAFFLFFLSIFLTIYDGCVHDITYMMNMFCSPVHAVSMHIKFEETAGERTDAIRRRAPSRELHSPQTLWLQMMTR